MPSPRTASSAARSVRIAVATCGWVLACLACLPACDSFGAGSSPVDASPLPVAPIDAAPPPPVAEAGPEPGTDAGQPDAPRVDYQGAETQVRLPPGAMAYTEADSKLFALLPKEGPSDSVAQVVGGLPTERWLSEAPATAFAMLVVGSNNSGDVKAGLVALVVEDGTSHLKVGRGHGGDNESGKFVAAAGSFAYLATTTDVRELSIEADLDIGTAWKTALRATVSRPFAVREDRLALLRESGMPGALVLHERADVSQELLVPGARKTFSPIPAGFQLLSMHKGGFAAAGRCSAGTEAVCVWRYTATR